MKVATIGEVLRQLRVSEDLTVELLANSINETTTAIYNYESGKFDVTYGLLEKYSSKFNVSISRITSLAEQKLEPSRVLYEILREKYDPTVIDQKTYEEAMTELYSYEDNAIDVPNLPEFSVEDLAMLTEFEDIPFWLVSQ